MRKAELHPKVAASTAAGALAVLIAFVISLCGVELPAEVVASLTVVLSAAAGYITPAS